MEQRESRRTELTLSQEVKALFEKAQRARNNQRIPEAIALYEQIRKHARQDKERNPTLAAECLHMVGVAHSQNDVYEAAETAYVISQAEFAALGAEDFVGIVLRDRAITALKQNHFREAEEHAQKSIALVCNKEIPEHCGISIVILGRIKGSSDNPQRSLPEAEQHIREGIRMLKTIPETFFLSTAYFDLAKILHEEGRNEEALKKLTKSELILDQFSKEDFQDRRKKVAAFKQQLLEGKRPSK